jgi:hypothetical protein
MRVVPTELPNEMLGLDVGHPLVVVEWHDAWFDHDLSGPDQLRPDYLVRTVGFLLADGPRVLSLAQEILPDGDGFRAVTHIPVTIVERVVRLSPAPGVKVR